MGRIVSTPTTSVTTLSATEPILCIAWTEKDCQLPSRELLADISDNCSDMMGKTLSLVILFNASLYNAYRIFFRIASGIVRCARMLVGP